MDSSRRIEPRYAHTPSRTIFGCTTCASNFLPCERLDTRRLLFRKVQSLWCTTFAHPSSHLVPDNHNNLKAQGRSQCVLDLGNRVSAVALDLLRHGPGFVPSSSKANQSIVEDVEVGIEKGVLPSLSTNNHLDVANAGPGKCDPKTWCLKAHGFQKGPKQ